MTSVSFGFDTVASLRITVPALTVADVRTDTLIGAKAVPDAVESERVHEKLFVD